MKILLVTRSYTTAVRKGRFLNCLKKAGFDIHVAAREDVSKETLSFPFYPLPESPYLNIESCLIPKNETSIEKVLDACVKELRPDLIISYSNERLYFSSKIAEKYNIPIISILRGFGTKFAFLLNGSQNFINEEYLRRSMSYNKHIVVSQNSHDAAILVKKSLVPKGRIKVIKSSGVDTETFNYSEESSLRETIKISLVSRMLWSKGINEFVNAAHLLKPKYPHTVFQLVGGVATCEESMAPEQLKHWTDNDVVEWSGYNHNISDVYKDSNIVVLPTWYGEGIPRSVIEASLCGRAVIVSDNPACLEVVRDGENGLVVPMKDCVSLVSALEKLIIDPVLRSQLGKKASITAQEFSTKNVASQYIDLIKSLKLK